SFKPFFIGRFEQRSDAVYLTGQFTVPWITKLFTTIWLGVLLLLTPILLVATLRSRSAAGLAPVLVSSAMLVGGFAIAAFGKRLSRDDPSWLAEFITTALQ